MTRCGYIEPRLRAYVDGELPDGVARQVALHLESCAGCRGDFDLIRKTVRMLRSCPVEEPPPHFSANLQVRLASLRAARAPSSGWRRWFTAARSAPPARRRWGVAGLVGGIAAALLVATFAGSRRPGAAEVVHGAELSWRQVRNYSTVMTTTGVYQGRPREFRQKTWFRKPGTYRFETDQDYHLVTIVDPAAVRHYIEGGDWRGRGPLLIVRPRTPAALPFPYGISWPSGPNMTLDSLVSQLQATRDAELVGEESFAGRPCYRLQFDATPPGGRVREECTMWLARDSLLPLRIRRYRDAQNHTDTVAERVYPNTELPSNVFDIDPPPGTVVIHGDVDPHVFALKPPWTPAFDRDPLGATRREVAARAKGLPFAAMAPTFLPPGYHLVRARAALGRWLDIHWIDDRPSAARVMRLGEQNEAADDPPETRGGKLVPLGPVDDPVPAHVVQGSSPYPYCYVSWREHGALLTLATAEMSLAETLRVARSVRVVPLTPPAVAGVAGPPAPEDGRGNPVVDTAPAAQPAPTAIEVEIAPAATEPPMVPDTAEDDHSTASPPK